MNEETYYNLVYDGADFVIRMVVDLKVAWLYYDHPQCQKCLTSYAFDNLETARRDSEIFFSGWLSCALNDNYGQLESYLNGLLNQTPPPSPASDPS